MAWNVRHYHTRCVDDWRESIWALVTGLIAAGAEVYGSSDGTSFDNSGAGATNYWVDQSIIDTPDAWLRLRWPAVGGVTRELLIDYFSTLGRESIYFSSDGIGFVTGASAAARPTAADEQYVQPGGNYMTETRYTYPAGANALYYTLITGDADEGYSFFWGTKTPAQFTGFGTLLFMDVLSSTPAANADSDPCIYGFCTSEFPAAGSFTSMFADTTINNTDDNIGGWFRKGESDEAWTVYPLTLWGINGPESHLWERTRLQEREVGWYEYKMMYMRSRSRFASELGMKGRSRLFGAVSPACYLGPNVDGSRRHVGGGLTLPWDGSSHREL